MSKKLQDEKNVQLMSKKFGMFSLLSIFAVPKIKQPLAQMF